MTKPRVFISSDIGGSDKDDDQSMVHALLYADKLRIEGLVSSPAPHGGRASDIREVIDAYALDYANLRTYSSGYPTPEYLRSVTHQGATGAQPSAGYSSSTAGSRAIVEAARDGSAADPLYILTWGAMTDVAQALHDAPDIVSKVRLISIGSTNTTFDPNARNYIHRNMDPGEKFEKLWWIESNSTFRGMYVSSTGANDPSIHINWINANAVGHGALGDYFKKKTVDLYGPGSPDGLKMGDTPSLMYLLDQVSNNDPTANSWGGSFVKTGRAPNYWSDSKASEDKLGSYYGAKTVFEHRSAYLKDFALRFDRADAPNGGVTPTSPPPPPPPSTTTAKIGTGTTEAESLALTGGYARESKSTASGDAQIKVLGSGEAAGTFTGASGSYKMTVNFVNESDGVSSFAVKVNGVVVQSWTGSGTNSTDIVQNRSFTLSLKQGDKVSIAGKQDGWELARVDYVKIEAATTSSSTSGTLPLIRTGQTEAEALKMAGGYTKELHHNSSGGANLKVNGSGSAQGVFDGEAGTYKMSVRHLNEPDGASSFGVKINGQTVSSWTGTGGDNTWSTRSFTVSLKDGDTIALTGVQQNDEHARMDTITLEKTTTSSPTGTSSGPLFRIGLTEAESLTLSGGYARESRSVSSGGANIKVDGSGKAEGTFDGPSGSYKMAVNYLNENDGASAMSVKVNGTIVNSWTGTGGTNAPVTRSFTLNLADGDIISLNGVQQNWEHARFDWVKLEAATTTTDTMSTVEGTAVELIGVYDNGY